MDLALVDDCVVYMTGRGPDRPIARTGRETNTKTHAPIGPGGRKHNCIETKQLEERLSGAPPAGVWHVAVPVLARGGRGVPDGVMFPADDARAGGHSAARQEPSLSATPTPAASRPRRLLSFAAT